jgi:hypothetical protein
MHDCLPGCRKKVRLCLLSILLLALQAGLLLSTSTLMERIRIIFNYSFELTAARLFTTHDSPLNAMRIVGQRHQSFSCVKNYLRGFAIIRKSQLQDDSCMSTR